jgi:hypothetical protein
LLLKRFIISYFNGFHCNFIPLEYRLLWCNHLLQLLLHLLSFSFDDFRMILFLDSIFEHANYFVVFGFQDAYFQTRWFGLVRSYAVTEIHQHLFFGINFVRQKWMDFENQVMCCFFCSIWCLISCSVIFGQWFLDAVQQRLHNWGVLF